MSFNPQTINSYNLNPNIGVGINVPFNTSSPSQASFYATSPNTTLVTNNGVFSLNYNTNEAIKNNLINFMLTNQGELPLNPTFGGNLRKFIFNQINELTYSQVKSFIIKQINQKFPMITILSINITSPPQDNNTIIINLNYQTPSATTNTVTFNF